jgi:aflatoxin B1 aldehyde reductase
MANKAVKIVFGGAAFGAAVDFSTPEQVEDALNVLEKEGIKAIDTAQAYGTSEEMLGKTGAAARFVIDTKYPGGLTPNDATKETVIAGGRESLKKLNTTCVSESFRHKPSPGFYLV